MVPDEVDGTFAQCQTVIDTGTRPWLVGRPSGRGNWQPGGAGRKLLLEFPIESLLERVQREATDSRASQTIV